MDIPSFYTHFFLLDNEQHHPSRFDFNNAHARWLRGLSLQHHFARPLEAEQECRRAVECARMQGAVTFQVTADGGRMGRVRCGGC